VREWTVFNKCLKGKRARLNGEMSLKGRLKTKSHVGEANMF